MTTATTKRKKAAPKTFQDAFNILKTNAETLQSQDEPDIDNLMSTVEESIAAYRICEARLDAIEQALNSAFAMDDKVNEEE